MTTPDPWPTVAARLAKWAAQLENTKVLVERNEIIELVVAFPAFERAADLRTALSLIAEMRADHAENFAGKVVMTLEAFEALTQRAEAAEREVARMREALRLFANAFANFQAQTDIIAGQHVVISEHAAITTTLPARYFLTALTLSPASPEEGDHAE